MKKVILGTAMLISGILGFVGLVLSYALSYAANKEYFSVTKAISETVSDQIIVILFVLLALAGLVVGIMGLFEKKQ